MSNSGNSTTDVQEILGGFACRGKCEQVQKTEKKKFKTKNIIGAKQ
jgi:hypothetical protein